MSDRVLIAGGGITGLAAAYYLQKEARAAGRAPEILVVERDGRLGGQVQTELVDGLIIEEAPDSFLARKPWFADLCRELNLPLVSTNDRIKKTYILHNGRLEPIPEGMQLFMPTKLMPFLESRLLSTWGKLRALMEPLVPIKRDGGDESTGSFVARRFGREVLDRIAAPLVAGVYGGDPYELSLKATFPQFPKLEQEKGSLLRNVGRAAPAKGTTGSAFQTVAGGLGTVVDALVRETGSVTYRTNTALKELAPAANGQGYVATLDTGEQIEAGAVILTLPAFGTAPLVQDYLPDVAAELNQIEYATVVVAALAYNRADIDHPLDATGFLVPRTERLPITASTWVSSKWPHMSSPDKVLIRGFLGRERERDWSEDADHVIVEAVRESLRKVMGIAAEPILTRVFRWKRSRPRYKVGHLARVGRIDSAMKQAPGLYLAGAAYRGLGLPDCVREGADAAQRAARHLGWKQ